MFYSPFQALHRFYIFLFHVNTIFVQIQAVNNVLSHHLLAHYSDKYQL